MVVPCQEDCAAIGQRELKRGFLTELDKVRISAVDQVRLAQNRSPIFPGSAWCARLEDLPLTLVHDLPRTELWVPTSVIRPPEEEEYVPRALRVWDKALQGPVTLTCEPRPEMVALETPFLTGRTPCGRRLGIRANFGVTIGPTS